MNDRQLRSFLITCNHNSFSKAAQELYISTPALIQQITLLEEDVGVPLFNRSAKGIALTKAGESFRETASEILTLYQKGMDKCHVLSLQSANALRIGVDMEDIPPFLAALYKGFQEENPSIEVQFIPSSYESQLEDCREGRFEVFPFRSFPLPEDDPLCFTPLYTDETYLVMTPGHPLAEKESLTLKDFEGFPLYPERTFPGRGGLKEELEKQNLRVHLVSTPPFGSSTFQIYLGKALQAVPGKWLPNYCPPLVGRRLEGHPRTYGLVHTAYPSEMVLQFIEQMKAALSPERSG